MNADQAKALRAPFPDEAISLLPKLNCNACTKSQDKHCDRHQKGRCPTCNAWISSAHIHLSYVGHAETTDRFIEVDPEWTWEPMAYDERGLPAFDGNGGLWMWVTIAGTRKPGYGDAQGKQGPNAVKEAIGDGLRNAGMRFGVALDLWAKSDLAAIRADKETGAIVAPDEPQDDRLIVRRRIWTAAQARGLKSGEDVAVDYAMNHDGQTIDSASVAELVKYAESLEKATA